MATHLPLPKVSITSTDSGYDSKNHSIQNLAAEDTTVHQRLSGIREESVIPPHNLHLLSPRDNVQEPHRARKSSTGSTASSSYSSDTSTPGSTRPLLPDQSTPKSKRQDLSLKVDESSQKQDTMQQKSKSSELMTSADEKILCDIVRCEMPTFVNNTDFKTLCSHLHSRDLLHPSDYETLTSMPSNKQRGNHLYMQILPHKGSTAYRQIYECLKDETEHRGHRDLVKILDKALNDRYRPQSSLPNDTSLTKLNYTDEIILRESIYCQMSTFVDNTDFITLSSHLYSRKLLHSSDYETLTSMLSNKERGNHLYMQILPHKGRTTYRLFYECLKNETEHMGHTDLLKILDEALKDGNWPLHSPTEDNESAKSTYLRAKLLCCAW